MKISVNDKEIFSISETKKKIMQYVVASDIWEHDMKRRIHWVINEIYKESLKYLKNEWLPKLKERGVKNIPLNDEELAELIFKQPDYKDRVAREAHRP